MENSVKHRTELISYFQERMSIGLSEKDVDENLLASGLIDSLQLIELIIWVESKTNEPVAIDQLIKDGNLTINNIQNYLNDKL